MIGLLCEKPSAMRDFAKALGGQQGKFNGEDYILCCARGHLYELKKPSEQVCSSDLIKKYKSWNVENLPWDETDFLWLRESKQGVSSTLKNIKQVLSKCDEIGIATDDDPTGEGSLLGWEIIDELGLNNKKISRLFFTDSVKSMQDAFINRKYFKSSGDDPDYVKAWYRSRFDFCSMQFTRIATMNGDGKSVLRNGRLKSYINKIVGEQVDECNNYKAIPSYTNKFKDECGVTYSNPDEPQFKTRDEVVCNYHDSAVVVDKKTNKTQSPPKLLDLASISANLAKKGFKADQVLKSYQKMYEAKIVSYPRTADKYITEDQFNDLLPYVDRIAKVVGVDPSLLTNKKPRKTHVKNDGITHGANRPALNVPNSLDDLSNNCEKEIYLLVAKNYLAMLCEDYKYEHIDAHLQDYPEFKGSCNVPMSLGFKQVFNMDEISEDDKKSIGTKASPFIYEGFPPRPQQPTMSWVMKKLERFNVGTGATRASTYAEMINDKAKYPLLIEKSKVAKKGERVSKDMITLSKYGDMNYRLLENTNIGDINLTEHVFNNMDDIASGKKSAEECLYEIRNLVVEDIAVMNENGKKLRKDLGIKMAEKAEYATGNWNGKDVKFKRVQRGYRLSDSEVEKLLNGETIPLTFNKKGGGTYDMDCKLANLEYDGHKYVGLDCQFPERPPKKWCGHTFDDEEYANLSNGLWVIREDWTSKKGNTFTARVKYDIDPMKDPNTKTMIMEFDF